MTIFIDGDACPVNAITEKIAKSYGIPLVLLCDTSHVLRSDYAKVIVKDAGADSVDFALVNLCSKGDIVISQDYGVAAMALAKKAAALNQNGIIYTDDNIGLLLEQRHIAKVNRARGKAHLKGPKKRTDSDDKQFAASLNLVISNLL